MVAIQHAQQNYTSRTCTRVTMSSTLNQLVHLLLEYFCDDASAYSPVSLPECESLVHLQGNVIFESQCQGCVIARHHHLLVCDTGRRGGRKRMYHVRSAACNERLNVYLA